MSRDQFAKALAAIAEALGHTMSDAQVAVYYTVLSDDFKTVGEFKQAAVRLLKSWSYGYMPKPAHFIEATKLSDGELDMAAESSWGDVIDAIRGGAGYTASVTMECHVAAYAVSALGGFGRLCTKTSDELEWLKKDFVRIYKNAYKTGRVAEPQEAHNPNLLDDHSVMLIESRLPDDAVRIDALGYRTESRSVSGLIARAVEKIKITKDAA